jgi:hypothetical protein
MRPLLSRIIDTIGPNIRIISVGKIEKHLPAIRSSRRIEVKPQALAPMMKKKLTNDERRYADACLDFGATSAWVARQLGTTPEVVDRDVRCHRQKRSKQNRQFKTQVRKGKIKESQ